MGFIVHVYNFRFYNVQQESEICHIHSVWNVLLGSTSWKKSSKFVAILHWGERNQSSHKNHKKVNNFPQVMQAEGDCFLILRNSPTEAKFTVLILS